MGLHSNITHSCSLTAHSLHNGPTKVPQEESDPRITLEPNFYYPQEDAVYEWCRRNSAGWNIAMPSYILGAVPDAAMNAAFPLAVYASVCKHLGQPMDYPCDLSSYHETQTASSAMLNAYLEEWSVLTDEATDQRFNACDSSAFAWEKTWPRIAGWYGIKYDLPDLNAKYIEIQSQYDPPPRGCVKAPFCLSLIWFVANRVLQIRTSIKTSLQIYDGAMGKEA